MNSKTSMAIRSTRPKMSVFRKGRELAMTNKQPKPGFHVIDARFREEIAPENNPYAAEQFDMPPPVKLFKGSVSVPDLNEASSSTSSLPMAVTRRQSKRLSVVAAMNKVVERTVSPSGDNLKFPRKQAVPNAARMGKSVSVDQLSKQLCKTPTPVHVDRIRSPDDPSLANLTRRVSHISAKSSATPASSHAGMDILPALRKVPSLIKRESSRGSVSLGRGSLIGRPSVSISRSELLTAVSHETLPEDEELRRGSARSTGSAQRPLSSAEILETSQREEEKTKRKASFVDTEREEYIRSLVLEHSDMQAKVKSADLHVKGVQRNYQLLANQLYHLQSEHEAEVNLNAQLTKEAREFRAQLETFGVTKAELSRIERSYEELGNRFAAAVDQRDQHQQDLQAARKQLKKAVRERKQLEVELVGVKTSERSLFGQLEATTKELQNLGEHHDNKHSDLRRVIAGLQEELQLKDRNLFELTLAMRKQENQMTVIAQSKEVMKSDAARLQAAMTAMSSTLQSTGRKSESRETMERHKLEIKGMTLENTSLQQRIKRQSGELAKLKADLEGAEKVVREMRADMEAERRNHEEEITQLTSEIASFHKQFESMLASRQGQDSERNSAREEMNSVRQNEAKLLQELKALREREETLRSTLEAKQAGLQGADTELAALRKLYESQSAVVRELTEASRGAKEAIALQELNLKDEMRRLLQQQKAEHDGLLGENKAIWETELSLAQAKLAEAQQQNKELLNVLNAKPSITQAELDVLAATEKELQVVLGKFVASEEAASSSYTCTECMELFRNPVTVVPCGHNFCKTCVDAKQSCPKCGPGDGEFDVVPNALLGQLCEKHTYRLQALAGIPQAFSSLFEKKKAEH